MKILTALVLWLATPPLLGQSPSDVKAAVHRALPILQKSAAIFVTERACVSCHHNALAILTFHLAQRRGFKIDSSTLDLVEEKTFRQLRGPNALDDAIQAANLSDPTPNDSYLLMAAEAAGLDSRSATLNVHARRIARWQRDGHWITSDFRPPHSSSTFTATATAIRAIRFYMPQELAAERDLAIRNARQWLYETRPESTEDAAFRLMGLAWAGASADQTRGAVVDLLALQKSNGGWAQLQDYDPDAYSTGEALYALHEAGLPIADRAWQKGARFLISTQAKDGTWRVRTRMLSPAEVSPTYFSTGFPYKKDEFLSYAGTTWAVMALLSSLPEIAADPSVHTQVSPVADLPVPWARTALLGTAQELAALLAAGLDANSRTPNGTTLLMMAATDDEKVRLLISKGADVKARATSGVDAVTIASTYYGSAPSLRSLLSAGAAADAPEDVHVRRSPLVYSAMAGDLEAVKALLSGGAHATAEALAEAVTFGHPDVVRLLITNGADAGITERSGINLLHWAAITNRSQVIPVLAAAGVPLDAVDEFGFTPLLYAATLDEGDTETLNALLRAGADKRVRNPDGRTPLDQARRLKHSKLATALKP